MSSTARHGGGRVDASMTPEERVVYEAEQAKLDVARRAAEEQERWMPS